jgi:hypothetical protein
MSEIDDLIDTLGVHEKVEHKIWKVRRSGYEGLTKLMREAEDNNDKIFNRYGAVTSFAQSDRYKLVLAPRIKTIILDKNVVAQERGLDVVLAWLDRFDNAKK